jgi:uncharacterized protein YbjT (DUF2867 family)
MGATGQTGGAVLRALADRGAPVRAISRDPARADFGPGVEGVAADAGDAASLARAFEGCAAVYVLCVPNPDVFAAARAVAAGVAEAVRRARPGHVVALSSEGAHLAEGNGVIATLHGFETALADAGAHLTRIRATYFMENWAGVLAPARTEGVLPSFLQPVDRAQHMVAVADIGATAAEALIGPAPVGIRIVNLDGPRDYTPAETAEAFAAALGKPVFAVAPPRDVWVPALESAGLGASYAAGLAAMYDGINAGVVRYEPGVGEHRRGATPLADVIRRLVA